ncbi:MAG: bis(5'-nucleosyl)-tetraphosphatase (symmetrical) YqeK [Halanaerobiales bacterium]
MDCYMEMINKIKQNLAREMEEQRYQHTLRVMKIAVELARENNVSQKKAKVAALLHDYTKNWEIDKIKKLVKASCWQIDQLEYSIDKVLHAPASACIARKKYNISDFQILEAIRYHTIGNPNMGKLSYIIFAADIIEPGRNFPGVDNIRNEIHHNFKNGIKLICEQSIKYNIKKNRLIHPGTLKLRNSLLEGNN